MLSYNPSKRPSIQEIRNNSWMKASFQFESTRDDILADLYEYEESQNDQTMREEQACRGDLMLDLIRETNSENLGLHKFDKVTEYDI